MVKIGDYNRLAVTKIVDFGVYLDGGNGVEILLPAKYIEGSPEVGQELDVFVYTDSEDRLIATTEHPFARVGQFAFLEVVDVNKVGAFLDWGLSKNILVPFSEQKSRMKEGGVYLVYVYLDNATKRVVATAKIEKYLGNVPAEYRRGQEVDALVWQHTPIGYRVIVDNLHNGMIYENELFRPLEIGQSVKAYVKQVREDGKIDLTLSGNTSERVATLADRILHYLELNHGSTPINDKSDPAEIEARFQCSKKDFKKAVGSLYKQHRILISPEGISLAKPE
ncbi:MAG: S1-like domain-containing RNA-binding protein [Bacteroidales bacterium]|nr:S1-like domain-containing RNA-binding protein [Bacteroidales bacterium]